MKAVQKVRLYVTLDDRCETAPKTKVLNIIHPFTYAQLTTKIAQKLKIDGGSIQGLEGYHKQDQTHYDIESDEDEFDCDDVETGTIIYVCLKKRNNETVININANAATPTHIIISEEKSDSNNENTTSHDSKNNNTTNINSNVNQVITITSKTNDDSKTDTKAETLDSLLDSQMLRNPYIVINGISDYSKAEPKGVWQNLDGVIVDIKNIINLWHDIYGYNNMTVSLHNYTQQKNNNTISDSVSYAPLAMADSNSYNDFLVGIRLKIDSNKCYDGLIYYYSGHGVTNGIILENGEKFSIKRIFQTFNGTQCVLLRDKPKIMIFDSCRGRQVAGTYDVQPTVVTKGPNNPRNAWIDSKFHANAGLATIFSNFEDYSINDSDYGGCLTRAICKVFNNPQKIVNHSLRDLIVALRRQTKIYSGRGNVKEGASSELVDFHETLEYKLYFRSKNVDYSTLNKHSANEDHQLNSRLFEEVLSLSESDLASTYQDINKCKGLCELLQDAVLSNAHNRPWLRQICLMFKFALKELNEVEAPSQKEENLGKPGEEPQLSESTEFVVKVEL